MRCVAVIAVRNGRPYLQRCLDHLIAEGIEIAIIDNMSSDGSYEACLDYLSRGICALERLDYRGVFSLREQLQYKQKLTENIAADWIIHQDIDELLQSPRPGENLLSAIQRADRAGANCINFDEFVFLPYADEIRRADFFSSPYYYFFQPNYPRLMRAWKKSSGLSNIGTGGHRLQGDVIRFQQDFVLRHYIFTSQQHALEKYRQRRFSEQELAGGWHRNRLDIPTEKLLFPAKTRLKCLPAPESRTFDKSDPWSKHYWEL